MFLLNTEIQNYILITQNTTSPIKNSIKTILKILLSPFALLGKIMDSKLISFSCAFKKHVKHGNISKKETCRNRAYKHYIKLTQKSQNLVNRNLEYFLGYGSVIIKWRGKKRVTY